MEELYGGAQKYIRSSLWLSVLVLYANTHKVSINCRVSDSEMQLQFAKIIAKCMSDWSVVSAVISANGLNFRIYLEGVSLICRRVSILKLPRDHCMRYLLSLDEGTVIKALDRKQVHI